MATTTVQTLDDLYQALATANGGDTIELASGDYGDLNLISKGDLDFTFPSNVTITSADPDNPAVFSGLNMRDASNLTFDGILFDYTFETGDQIFGRPFNVESSDNITITNSTFDGDVARGVSDAADDYGFGIGLSFSDSSGITVENNEVFNFHRGMTITRSNDVEVLRNDVHTITSDGMNFSQIDTVLIEGNYLHDFNASPTSLSHRDMIQFWTNGTTEPSKDITITGNHLDIGEGSFTQSIFMRNDQVDLGKAGTEMFYQNVEITDNVIVNGHRHGINLGESNGVTIANNSVLHSDGNNPDGTDSAVEIPRIAVAEASTNVSISQNITSTISGWTNQPDWQINNNAFVQDQDSTEPGFYGDVFVATSLQTTDGVHNFVALSGGMADLLNAGATATHATVQNNELAASFHIETQDNNPAVRTFDASTTLMDGQTLPDGTTYVWNFGDGQTGTGQRATHSYSDGGSYDVTLTIRLPDGRSDRIDTAMDVAGSSLLSMRSDGHFISHSAGAQEAVNVGGMATTDGLRLGVGENTPTIGREHVERLLHTDEFNIDMSLQADKAGDGGEVFRLHGTIVTSITDAGDVYVILKQDDGELIKLTTAGGGITDKASHDVSIDLQNGTLTVSIDGIVRGTVPDVGPLRAEDSQDLVFGNPWGKDSFDGMLTDFTITTNESDYGPTFTQPTPPAPVAPTEPSGAVTLADLDLDIDFAPEPEVPVAAAQPNLQDGAIALGGLGVAARLEHSDVDFLQGADAFDISMTIQADSDGGGAGELFRMQGSLLASVNDDGDMVLRAFTTDGIRTRVVSEGADLADGDAHDISISLSDGLLSIQIDDGPITSTPASEALGDYGNQDLLFGNPRGRDNFEGTVLSFEASAPAAAGAPEGRSVSLDAANHSAAPTILADVLQPTPVNQNAAASVELAADGMETESGPFDLYYHDLSYFYAG